MLIYWKKQELVRHCVLAEMEQNAAIKAYEPEVKGEILSPSIEVLDESKISEEKYQRACEVRDEYKFRYLHYKQQYEKVLEEKEALLKVSADRAKPQTEMWALKAQVESLQDELEGYKSKVEEYKTLLENSCMEKEEIIRKSLEKVEQRALEAQVASLQDELQAYAECRSKLLQQEELYKKALMENKLLKTNSSEYRALELQVASLQDELTRSNNQYAELSKRYAEKEKQFSDLEVKRCPACRASCSINERQKVKNELAEGLIQERNVLEEFRKKQSELVLQLESRTKALVSSQERCLRLEAQVKEDQVQLEKLREEVDRLVQENPTLRSVGTDVLKGEHSTRKPADHKIVSKKEEGKVEKNQVELDKLREEVDKLMKENPSLKPAQMDMLKGDHSTWKPVVHKIVSKEEEGKIEEDQVELDKLREEVDNLMKDNPSLEPVQMDMLKGDHSTRKPVVSKEEGKGKRTRRRKNADEGVTAQDIKESVQHAPPSPLCEAGLKEERNLRKRVRNQSDKLAELAEDLKTLHLKPEKKEKARTKRAPRPRKKKVQDENDPTQDNKSLQSELKLSRSTRSQRKKTVPSIEKVDTSPASAATRSQRV